MLRTCCVCFGLALALIAPGCGERVQEKEIQVKAATDPLSVPRSILQRYAEGQALGSESTSFTYLVETLRKTDAAKADVLKQGFDDIQKANPAARPQLAKDVLQKL